MCVSSRYLSNSRDHQQGTVLVLVLLIVTIVAGLSVKYAAEYQLGLARAETRWHGAQSRAVLEGTEQVASLLFQVADLDPNIDYLGEPWGSDVPIQDDGITGTARLVDATAQLNLNDLGTPLQQEQPVGSAQRYSEPQRRFIRLLQTFPDIPIQRDQAEYLMEAIVDWIDTDDNESGQGGAENNYYQSTKERYRAANGPFKSVEELRLIRGFNEFPLLVVRLTPFITVLPSSGVGMNVNTIPLVETTGRYINNLWRIFNSAMDLEPLDETRAKQLAELRPPTGFSDPSTISQTWDRVFSGSEFSIDGLGVKTGYFWLFSTVQIVEQRRTSKSLMVRAEANGLRVVQREDVFELPTFAQHHEDDEEDTELVE